MLHVMDIKAQAIKLVSLSEIKLNPKNRNKHSAEQIARIAEILKYQGFRRPGTISNQTGNLVCGEGRYLAAKKLGLKAMPIMYQDYDSEEQEYADGIADNAVDKWAELDKSLILQDILDLGPDFNLDMLGVKSFVLPEDFSLKDLNESDENSEWVGMPEFTGGGKYIAIIFHFKTELEREVYAKDHKLEIDTKKSGQWIVYR